MKSMALPSSLENMLDKIPYNGLRVRASGGIMDRNKKEGHDVGSKTKAWCNA